MQELSSKESIYADRLREERVRIDPHQGRFAETIDVTRQKQSFLELGERELRADYLDRISTAGLDVMYILTGERCVNKLDPEATELVNAFLKLPHDLREPVLLYVRSFAQAVERLGGNRQEQKQPADA